MSASLFLDTLRQHDLEQFYTTFSNHGINHLNGLAQLSLQDCAALGITDAVDRRKVFNLIQSLRNPNRLRIMTSASTLTSGLRQPQKYPRSAYEPSRLPQPQSAAPALDHTRARRQSIVSHPNQQQRPVRTRTMSDAGRLPDTSRKLDLPRSLLSNSSKNNDDDDDDEDEDDKPKSYRQSAPLLNAYGIPSSQQQKMRGRASMGALRPPGIRTQNLDSLPPSDLDQRIRVCVRKRPLSKKEIERGEKDIGKAIGTRSIQINEPKLRLDLTKYIEQHTFTFDDVFDADTSNDVIYERTALPLVKYIFQGGKATCFAYGQTGSGKTYTMLDPQHGLYIRATRDIFSLLGRPENQHLMAWVGLYEIYQGHLYDLLNGRKKLFAREDGRHNVVIAGLKEYAITKASDMVQVFEYGNQVRTTGSTGANDTSSRSHAVLQILLKPKKNRKVIHGKLSFIDLAGSERGADRGESDAKTRLEGAEINKSLLALKECIRALDLDKGHTPFRQSKLTQVLKDSFVGNSRTCMIATISPGASNSEHTLNTLRYADRVKELRGDKERRATAATTAAAAAATGPPPSIERRIEQPKREESWQSPASSPAAVTSISAEFSDEEYDSYTDESDILNDDDDEEEDIFDVDFPHEQDAFINSTTPASPPPRRRSSTPYYPSKPIDYTSDQSLENSPVSSPEPLHQLDASQMEDFVNLHRAQIREVTEYTKREAKLVGKISLSDNDPEEFERYLQELQEILEEKAAAVEVLRDRIHDTVNQLLKN